MRSDNHEIHLRDVSRLAHFQQKKSESVTKGAIFLGRSMGGKRVRGQPRRRGRSAVAGADGGRRGEGAGTSRLGAGMSQGWPGGRGMDDEGAGGRGRNSQRGRVGGDLRGRGRRGRWWPGAGPAAAAAGRPKAIPPETAGEESGGAAGCCPTLPEGRGSGCVFREERKGLNLKSTKSALRDGVTGYSDLPKPPQKKRLMEGVVV